MSSSSSSTPYAYAKVICNQVLQLDKSIRFAGIWRVSEAISQFEVKFDLEANNIRHAIDAQTNSFKTIMNEMLAQVFEKIDHSIKEGLTKLNLSQSNLRLITSLSPFGVGDRNCWKDGYFSDADIKNGYDARRPVTDDIIKSIEENEGTIIYGDPYVGKSILVKRVIFEMVNNEGYVVIYASDASGVNESKVFNIKDLLNSLSEVHPKILFVADDAHRATNELFFKIFDEIYGMTDTKNIRFLFAGRERQLDKEKAPITRALRKIPDKAIHHIHFSEDDALLFFYQALKVTYQEFMPEVVPTDLTNALTNSMKTIYEQVGGDPFMFNLEGIDLALLAIEYILNGKNPQELIPTGLASRKFKNLIKKIDDIEREEGIHNNELWMATLISAIMGIVNIPLDRAGHPKLFSCSRIIPERLWTLQKSNILLKESDGGQLRIRHEVFAWKFLSIFYAERFFKNPESFNSHYGYIIKCVWNSIGVDETIDMLRSCSYLYDIEDYKPISELITSHYLVPLDQYLAPPGIPDSDKARLFCYGLGNFYAMQKQYERSLECYDKALEAEPNDVETWYNKGLSLHYLHRYEEAIKCYDKALEAEPNYAKAWYNKGLALSDLHRYEE
jgi:tetratricopeptide (TPR) repeat protein